MVRISDEMKYPKRTSYKILTLVHILKAMPATFTVLQERVRTGRTKKKISPSLLDKYLTDLIKWKLVRKDRNLYCFDSTTFDELGRRFEDSKILWALLFLMPVKCRRKKGRIGEEPDHTIAELMGWIEETNL